MKALIWLPDFDAASEVEFLVDTGADLTVIHPEDSARLLTAGDWERVRRAPARHIGGAGRELPYFGVAGVIQFIHDDESFESLELTVYIGEIDPATEQIESLLGRDVLQHFVTTFDGLERLTLEPRA